MTDKGAQYEHQPVMLEEVLDMWFSRGDGFYVDGTFGRGGHSRALLEKLDAQGRLAGIDRDPQAVAAGEQLASEDGRFQIVASRFDCLPDVVDQVGRPIDGLLLDLGVSSPQLDDAGRGFSFLRDGPLDMRMSQSGETAADVVMQLDETALARILWEYGEERASRRIARAIVRARSAAPIETTGQLAAIIHAVMPPRRPGQIDPATRSFQALRIHINRELGEVEDGLAAAEAMLRPGGILAVVSFHSLEDRIVKRFLTDRSGGAGRPSRHRPEMDGPAPTFERIRRKPILPDDAEQAANPRARSAKLRVGRRTDAPPATGAAALFQEAR